MKFGKDYEKKMVPEWKEAYMDYFDLKGLLKEIRLFKQRKTSGTPTRASQQRSMYKAFSGLTRQYSKVESPKGDMENPVITVNTVQREDSNAYYETKILMPADVGDHEIMFFKRLDKEFNKVDKFYKDKVKEVMNEAALLDKQMDALIALRIKVENPDFNDSDAMTCLSATEASGISTHSSARITGQGHMDSMHEVEMSSEGQLNDSTEGVYASLTHTNSSSACKESSNINDYRQPKLDILEHVKINNTLETPVSTIKGILKDSKEEELSFRREDLRKVEEQLKLVFVEFYQKLLLLKCYSFMNFLAFSKIMKKYDKVMSRRASRSYLNTVDNSYLGSSEEINNLLERVEATFITHFSNSNRRKGMKFLRPKAKREKHSITFLSGFFSGCTIALLVALVLITHPTNLMNREESIRYMQNIFPLYSFFAFIVLHMLLYAADIYFWRKYRINYRFIFDFKQGTELGYREVFLLSAGLSVLALAGVLANLHLEMNSRTQEYKTFTELIPLGLLCVVLVITFCPFNIIYRSSRFFLIRCIFRCICAPLYKVTLPDFLLADNLTSQVQAIRSLEFYICYYGWGDFTRRQNNCQNSHVYCTFYFIVAVIPYWIRFLQCLRRLFEDRDAIHAFNGLKYFITIIAVLMRTAYDLKKVMTWKVMAMISYSIATILNTYWDIVIDWGLLQRHSKNRWLRDKLLVSHKSFYFIAMVLNVLLRLSWLQLVVEFQMSSMPRTAMVAMVACLEILRRGIWNFFRLENEHLNNVGRYRAFKSVPIPFNYYDEDKDKDE